MCERQLSENVEFLNEVTNVNFLCDADKNLQSLMKEIIVIEFRNFLLSN